MENYNCNGSGPHSTSEVRLLPLPGDGNLILCRACAAHENNWRRGRNRELAVDARYPTPAWSDLAVYNTETT